MREDIKIQLLQNVLDMVTKKYDFFVNFQKELLKESFEKEIRDPLTGLYNRGYLMDFLKKLLVKSKRKKYKFTVIFLDINNFKTVNDNYGHIIGDKVLIDIADLLKKTFREYDLIARYGGDEFVVVIDEENDIDIKKIFERLNKNIIKNFKKYNISMAYGVAVSDEASGVQELLDLADKRMYENKREMKSIL